MAISHGNHMKNPRVTEKESDFEDSGSEVELGDDSEADSGEDYEMKSEQGDDLEDIEQELEEEEEEEEEDEEEEEEDDDDDDDSSLNEVMKGKPNDSDTKDMAQEDISSVADQAATLAKSVVNNTRVINHNSDESEMESDDTDDDFGDDESDKDDDGGKAQKSNKDKDKDEGNRGLANVMAMILGTRKSDNVILSKAKKDKTFVKEPEDLSEDSFEVVDESGKVQELKIKEEKEDNLGVQSAHETELQRKLWARRFRVKPDIKEDREKERRLKVLATQGVVQLFSAIEKHKSLVQKKISESRSVMEREKIMETTGKEAFLEVLRQQGKKVKLSQEEESVKEEIKDEQVEIPVKKKPRWNVLADNFYKEPTLQSWDQQSDKDD